MSKENENLKTKEQFEEVVNQFAEEVAKDYNIKPHQFRIILDRNAHAPMHCKGGPCVQIYLAWPYAMHKMNGLLRSAFNLMVSKGLLHPVELVPHTYHAEQRAGYVKWMRQKIGPDADALMNLVPKGSYFVRKETIVRLQDRKTGVFVEVHDFTGKRTSWDLEEEGRFLLTKELMKRELERIEEKKEERKQSLALVLCEFYEKQGNEWLELTVQPHRWMD